MAIPAQPRGTGAGQSRGAVARCQPKWERGRKSLFSAYTGWDSGSPLALVRPAPLLLIRHRHDFGVQVEKKNRETTKSFFSGYNRCCPAVVKQVRGRTNKCNMLRPLRLMFSMIVLRPIILCIDSFSSGVEYAISMHWGVLPMAVPPIFGQLGPRHREPHGGGS